MYLSLLARRGSKDNHHRIESQFPYTSLLSVCPPSQDTLSSFPFLALLLLARQTLTPILSAELSRILYNTKLHCGNDKLDIPNVDETP